MKYTPPPPKPFTPPKMDETCCLCGKVWQWAATIIDGQLFCSDCFCDRFVEIAPGVWQITLQLEDQ